MGGDRRAHRDDLRSSQHPFVAIAVGDGRHVLPILAGRRLRRGQRHDRGAGNHFLQQGVRRRASRPVQQATGHHDRVDVRLHHQRMPERLGDHHDFDWATADSAHVFGQRGTQDAEFVGESAPDVGLPTGAGLGRSAALLEVVPSRQEPAEPVA